MSDNTDHRTQMSTGPASNPEPADSAGVEDYDPHQDPDADPEMLNPRDLTDDRPQEEPPPDADSDADPDMLNARDDR